MPQVERGTDPESAANQTIDQSERNLDALVERALTRFNGQEFFGEGEARDGYSIIVAVLDTVKDLEEEGIGPRDLFHSVINVVNPFLNDHTDDITQLLYQPDVTLEDVYREVTEYIVYDHLRNRHPETIVETERREMQAIEEARLH